MTSTFIGGVGEPDDDDIVESPEELKAIQTFPTPSGIFETLTGLKIGHLESLGAETDVVELKLNAADTQEFLFHLFEDILHDSEGVRSDPTMKLNTMFSNPQMGADKAKCSLTHFMEVFLTGMNVFYGNTESLKPILWSDVAMKQKEGGVAEGGRTTRGSQPTFPWATAMSFQLPLKFYKTYPLYASIERRGMNESKHLLKSEMDLKELGKKYIHTNYTAEAIAYNNAYPVLINFDAGGDLMASILGMFSYTDISIVNVKDPGDSLRNRNKILSAIEKISNKYPTLIGTLFLDDFKKVNRIHPDSPKGAWAFLEACRQLEKVNINNGLFIDYVVKTYTSQMAKANGMLPTTREAILENYIEYVKKKFKKIMLDEKYVIHNKNVRFIVKGTASTSVTDKGEHGGILESELRLIDVEYYFDKDSKKMKIRFHGADVLSLKPEDYDRENINSASDVGKNIYRHQSSLLNIVKAMYSSSSNPKTLFEVLNSVFQKEPARSGVFKTCVRVYLECMYKYIGDFCQILYSFYLGSVFGSFDRSAVAVAFFVMRTLTENKEHYKRFKAYKKEDMASVERIRRGLIIATSATYHGKKAPTVSFYLNYDARNNIETGKTVMKKYISKKMSIGQGLLAQLSQGQMANGIDIERVFQLRKDYIHKKMRDYFRRLNTYYIDNNYLPLELTEGKDSKISLLEESLVEKSQYKSIEVQKTKQSTDSILSPARERLLLKKKKGSLLQRVQEQTRQSLKEWIDTTFKLLEKDTLVKSLALTFEPVVKTGKAKAAKASQTLYVPSLITQTSADIKAIYEQRLKEQNFSDKNNYLWNRLLAKIKKYNEDGWVVAMNVLEKLKAQSSHETNKASYELLKQHLSAVPSWSIGETLRQQYGWNAVVPIKPVASSQMLAKEKPELTQGASSQMLAKEKPELTQAAKPEGAKPEGAKPEGAKPEGAKPPLKRKRT